MRLLPLLLVPSLLLSGCLVDITLRGVARCDGVKQDSEESVDAPFDLDGDGWFDGNNEDCAEAYELVDCDDTNAAVNPGAVEELCDDLDNDCDSGTLDTEDLDGDGIDAWRIGPIRGLRGSPSNRTNWVDCRRGLPSPWQALPAVGGGVPGLVPD